MSKEPSEVEHKDDDHPKHELSSHAKRIYAIRELLIEKGVLTQDDIQRQLDYMETKSPANGAQLVARAWHKSVSKSDGESLDRAQENV